MRRVEMRAKHGWTHVAFVESETEADTEYEIKRHADGRTGCACHSYVFSKERPRNCKHVRALLGLPALPEWMTAEKPETVTSTVSVGAERFKVRRAISLRPLTAGAVRQAGGRS